MLQNPPHLLHCALTAILEYISVHTSRPISVLDIHGRSVNLLVPLQHVNKTFISPTDQKTLWKHYKYS
jgi:hypothetical protein